MSAHVVDRLSICLVAGTVCCTRMHLIDMYPYVNELEANTGLRCKKVVHRKNV